jgi:hypothetical protein
MYINVDLTKIISKMETAQNKFGYGIDSPDTLKRDYMIRILEIMHSELLPNLCIPKNMMVPCLGAIRELMYGLHDVDDKHVTANLFKSTIKRQGKKANTLIQNRRRYVERAVNYLKNTHQISENKAINLLAEKIGIKRASIKSDIDKTKHEPEAFTQIMPFENEEHLNAAVSLLKDSFFASNSR